MKILKEKIFLSRSNISESSIRAADKLQKESWKAAINPCGPISGVAFGLLASALPVMAKAAGMISIEMAARMVRVVT